MDAVLAQLFFVNAVRLARGGASASGVAGVVAVWGVVYFIACPIVGKFLTVANSTRLILASCLLLAVLCALHLAVSSAAEVYVLMGCAGIMAALFFPSFQIFMKAVDASQARPIAYSTGLYTFAWSMGYAVGPFVAGFLMECGTPAQPGGEPPGWKLAFLFGAIASLMAAGLVAFLKHLRKHPPAVIPGRTAGSTGTTHHALDYTRMPNFAWLGWLSAGVGVLVLSIIRGVFPARAVTVLGLSAGLQGTIFFLLSLTQACMGLGFCRSRLWMYRPLPVITFGLAGVAGALCLGYGHAVPLLLTGSLLFGLYSGAFYFYLVFHSLAHPSRSAQYVAINESVVGVGGILGPLLGGLLADRAGFGSAYLAGAFMILAAVAVQTVVHHRRPVSLQYQ